MTHERAPRIVVVQAEGFPEPDPPWLPVGVILWAGPSPRLGIVVKVTFQYGEGEVRPAPVQEPLSRGEPSGLPGAAPHELCAPDDFVPRKAEVDVLVTGHAFAAEPSAAIGGALRLGGLARPFVVRAGAPSCSIPLAAAYLAPGEPMGPQPIATHDEQRLYEQGFDFGVFNAAPGCQRIAELPPDARIVLEGLTRGRDRAEVALPGLAPVVSVSRGASPDEGVVLRCDTLWIDASRELVALVWRGDVDASDAAGDVSRIVVSLERSGAERAPEDRLAATQRGRFGFAERASDVEGGQAPAGEEERARIELARYQTWASRAPPPRMPLADYVRLAALLAEQPAARGAALARHDLDEDRYAIEERAWLEKMARAAGEGDVTLADEYSRLYAEAQEEIAAPVELDLAAYADLLVELDDADDPAAVLRDRGLSVPQWMRVDRRWTERAESDAAAAAELDAAVAAARARSAGAEGATS
ncbi:MAG: DUF2169 domain-containing protein [Polyangiaceae bacterium]|nr:DUF2169 domain-containing protein [Polyangiaceae bacterium]